MPTFKPMLAGEVPGLLEHLNFPVMVSPKYDGIRAIVIEGVVYSRSMKPIPNRHVQKMFSHLNGFDGELIFGSPVAPDVFRVTTSAVMSIEGTPDVWFYAFDYTTEQTRHLGWLDRMQAVIGAGAQKNLMVVPQHSCNHRKDIETYEAWYLKDGYEGVMVRNPIALYKNGRSTTREGRLLKLKRFADSEAVVLGMAEKLHNANEAKFNELGYQTRSSHQENMIGMDTMGALMVRDIKSGVEFNIGTGFDDKERARWWGMGSQATGRIVKYSYFPTGSKDKPRFPTYLGERDPRDM